MCFSPYAQYVERPVKKDPQVRPEGAPPTRAELDPNLFGPKPTPPEWQQAVEPSNSHSHEVTAQGAQAVAVQAVASNGNSISSVSTQTLEAVVVELADGTKLLICPL
jgi:hypothetical protein